MATLKENMDAIKVVKDSVIKPENIKKWNKRCCGNKTT